MKIRYTVDASVLDPVMLLNQEIGGTGINGADFQAELYALDAMGKDVIKVYINSPGGVIVDAYGIYNAILKSKTPVDTYIVGIGASAAALIFQAGRKRIMSDYGVLMYHNPQGDISDKVMQAMKESIVTMVAARSGHEEAQISEMMNKETWITAKEAVETGLADSIEDSGSLNKKRAKPLSLATIQDMWNMGDVILNSLPLKSKYKNKRMLNVTNMLGLVNEASDESISMAVSALIAENKASKEAIDAAKKALDDAEDKYNKLKNDADDASDKAKALEDKMKNDAEEAANDAAEDKAKNMVTGFATLGKIKNDAETIEFYTAIAKNNFEATKKQLENLPVNKSAISIPVTLSGRPVDLENYAGQRMAEISNQFPK